MKNKPFGRFLILWLGEMVSSIGSGLTGFGLGVYVFRETQSATATSLVTLCAFLPILLMAPIGGLLADRYDRRLMMLLGDGGSALGLAYLLLVMRTGEAELWQICTAVAISSVFASLTDPAYRASISDLLDEKDYAKASGMVQLAGAAKFLISPAAAAQLLLVTQVEGLLILDISTVLVTLVTVSLVRRSLAGRTNRSKRPASVLHDLLEGWNLITANRGVLYLTLLLTAVTFYVGFLETLYTPMVLPIADTQTLGAVQTVSAAGLLIGSLSIGMFGKSRRYTRMLGGGLIIAGVFFSLIGVSAHVIWIGAAGFLFFAAMPFVNTGADVMIRTNIPNEAQGRAWGIIGVISQLGYVVAYGTAGPLADRLFNPLLEEGGRLASTIGALVGVGPGRGIGLLIFVAGFSVILLGVAVFRMKSIAALEKRAASDLAEGGAAHAT
ncbi:MFS transporter [Cohnella xylanilytica]|uniref:MFS transporter n=1 Tax=Cohnella xylanilytica TaxID=557555 RepID=UPI001B09DA03|nr:MFS transporter [Cohnella xylanilytica]GIO15646.1 MFS transporter [Cohnella xylanilytica]